MWQSRILTQMFLTALTVVPALAIDSNYRTIQERNSTAIHASVNSYFREPTDSNLLVGHIALMSFSWLGAFPLYIMLDLAHSNLAFPAQIWFLGLHAVGSILGLAYNSRTLDLYPGSSHNKVGWGLTGIALFQFGLRVLRKIVRTRSRITSGASDEHSPFIPTSQGGVTYRDSTIYEDVEAEPSTSSACSSEVGTRSNVSDSETLYDVVLSPRHTAMDRRYDEPTSWKRRGINVFSSHQLALAMTIVYHASNLILLVLCFIAICTGIVTMTGILRGKHIFNGLAHFIKGGAFFLFGLITFARWMGCFIRLGWAWNLKPTPSRDWKTPVTMEGVECLVIFIYGLTNVFLEHLSAWGEGWVAQDFEHVAISLLFIGGGMCGMMVETRWFRTTAGIPSTDNVPAGEFKPILRPGYSINPAPAMIILILGIILGGHHQKTVESSMMHKWFGSLLNGAAGARCLTYILVYISPPRSITPPRVPSELVTSFCLMSAGIMLMASNRDTIDAMTANGMNAMLIATIDMGLVAALMSWCLILFVVKGWAGRREDTYIIKRGGMA